MPGGGGIVISQGLLGAAASERHNVARAGGLAFGRGSYSPTQLIDLRQSLDEVAGGPGCTVSTAESLGGPGTRELLAPD